MSPFNPFNPQTVFSLLACIVSSYALGVFLVKNQLSGLMNVGMRISLGAVFGVALIAVIQSKGTTVMLPILILFIAIAASNWIKERKLSIEDLNELNKYHWITLLGIFAAFYLLEGFRINIEQAGQIFVGNPDTAWYSGYGHSLFNSGRETVPEHHPKDTSSHLYHFGDLWMSGIISNIFGVLPYYANGLVLRVLCMGAITVSVFGWVATKKSGVILSSIVGFSVLYVIALSPFNLGEQAPMLFRWFRSDYPMYLKPSHLIIAICAIPILLLQLKRGVSAVTCIGLLWLPLLNLGMILMPVFGVFFWSLFVLFSRKMRTKENLQLLPILLVASSVPALYCWATGRLPTPDSHVSMGFVYLFLHTVFRTLLSQLLLFPYLVGAFLFWWSSDFEVRKVIVFNACLYFGAMVGFSYIYSQMPSGNTYQLLTLHFQSVFAPVGIFGFVLFLNKKKRIGVLGLSLIVGLSAFHCFNTQGHKVHYDWSYWGAASKDYHTWATIPVSDVLKMRTMFANLERVKLGYFICNPKVSERAHYSAFVQLKGLIPGLELYRLNFLASDTSESKEMIEGYKRTALGYEVFSEGDFDNVSTKLIKLIKPIALIRPVADNYSLSTAIYDNAPLIENTPNFCIPKEMLELYPKNKSTNQFVFYFNTEDESSN